MPIKIHNKEYTTVAERIAQMRDEHADWTLEAEVLSAADIVQIKATIRNEEGRVMGTGHAEEVRGSSNINSTSALENCETSAWGRALAACGWGGEQVASANEVSDAIINQAKQEVADWFIAHNKKVAEHIGSIGIIKDNLSAIDFDLVREENLSCAAEAWFELSEEDQRILWVAPSKGGMFSTRERETMQSTEFKQAHFGGE